jgi:glycosyltransferase involved in cell wall biosynthesis
MSGISQRPPATAACHVVLDTRVVTDSGGGPDKTILNSPRYFIGSGYRMLCAYMHPPGDPGFEKLQARAKAAGTSLISVPDRGRWDWRVVTQMIDICRRERVKIWHGHDYKSNALGLLIRRFRPMRLVTTVHGWVQETDRTPLYYKIDKFCLPYYERVLCVSPDLCEACLVAGVAKDRCILVENGIDLAQYQRRRSIDDAKKELGIPPMRKVLGGVGRLAQEKGFDYLLRAARELLTAGLDVEVLIVGEGQERHSLEALAKELGISDRVRMAGYQADPIASYEAMDIFVLSSLREGLPNVLLEALAMKIPVVATRIAGVPRLIEDGENGLLVEPASAERLASAIERLLRDNALQRRFTDAGRRVVEARYSFAGRIKKIQAIYDTLLSRSESAL